MPDRPDTAAQVLVIEDDPDLRRLLKKGLDEEGFGVRTAPTAREGMALATEASPDILVVDIGLPDADGRDVCQALRAQGVEAPVLFLTALGAVSDRVSGFNAGGDDYLTKPFAIAELVARLRALVKRSAFKQSASAGGLVLDPLTHGVSYGEKRVSLTPTEFRVLGGLVARHGEAVRRRDLISSAWPDGAIVHDNTLDVYIRRLRKKLQEISAELSIDTVHRVGYKLQ